MHQTGVSFVPTSFDIVIEALAIAMRNEADITGVSRGSQTQKWSLYADDLILYLSQYDSSIPTAQDMIISFGKTEHSISS